MLIEQWMTEAFNAGLLVAVDDLVTASDISVSESADLHWSEVYLTAVSL
jgi:hypothetical protein